MDILEKSRALKNILSYDLPTLKNNRAGCYIEFRAFDPASSTMRRKTIKLNHIHGKAARTKYAKDLIKRLTTQLERGWNPWICKDVSNLKTFAEAAALYRARIDKMHADNNYRKETYADYVSHLKILCQYAEKINPITYLYQFDRAFCSDFLDYIYIERNSKAQTRNNYLNFLRVFSAYLLEKGFITTKPTDGIQPISKRLYQKERTVIPLDVVRQIADHCSAHDPHFLLACYLLYYCFIRPVEMTRLKISAINIKASTITIPADASKNHKKQTITLPKKVLLYAIDLGIFSNPSKHYIFSEKLLPGAKQIDPKIFRDHWERLRRALRLRKEWKFYSLKDTGITEMIGADMDPIDVRDQARHSSLAITDIYTDRTSRANKEIISHDGSL